MYLSIAVLDPGDEIVCGWPSFPSYVLDALKLGAGAKRVPLTDHRYDVDAILGEIGPRTKIVYLCNPNNPTGTMIGRSEIESYFERVPGARAHRPRRGVLRVRRVGATTPTGSRSRVKAGRRALVLRTFSKIYGLAGLRVGYGVGPAEVVEAIGKVRNAFDINQTAQDAARASLGNDGGDRPQAAGDCGGAQPARGGLQRASASPWPRLRSPTSSTWRRVRTRARCSTGLLREGAIVRPLGPFGADDAIRVTVGTREENEFFAAALERVLQGAHTSF